MSQKRRIQKSANGAIATQLLAKIDGQFSKEEKETAKKY